MKEIEEFRISFSGLKDGRHSFHYFIDQKFFETFQYNEFNGVAIEITVFLQKNATSLSLRFEAEGVVNVYCDISNEPYDQPIKTTLDLLVKFGQTYNDEDDAILIIPHGTHHIDIAQYIYEMIVLAVPAKKIHPGIKDGSLSSDVVKLLKKLHPSKNKTALPKTDPRWDSLKKLVTDK